MLLFLQILSISVTIEVPITLPPSEYIGKVNDQLMVNISAFVIVTETDSVLVETFHFQSMDLKIMVGDGSGTLLCLGPPFIPAQC